jgi:hypothetical protein
MSTTSKRRKTRRDIFHNPPERSIAGWFIGAREDLVKMWWKNDAVREDSFIISENGPLPVRHEA